MLWKSFWVINSKLLIMTLGIYGAGGLGREVFELANIINNRNNLWNEIVFIDDSENTSNPRNALILKFEEIKNKYGIDNFEVCIAVGEPAIRKILMEKLSSFNIKLKSLIHPDVYIPKSTKIGKGSIINKYVSITCDIIIGDNVYIHPMACIGHDSIIGKNAIISSFVDVAGNCNVGNEAFLAIGTILKQGITIGEKSILGMGSIVHRNIPGNVIAMGNPARVMKKIWINEFLSNQYVIKKQISIYNRH